jgi:hypothetical protein
MTADPWSGPELQPFNPRSCGWRTTSGSSDCPGPSTDELARMLQTVLVMTRGYPMFIELDGQTCVSMSKWDWCALSAGSTELTTVRTLEWRRQ